MGTPVRNIPSLTGMRFFASAIIVIFHAAQIGMIGNAWLSIFTPAQAVSLFYVLSGFILQLNYGDRLHQVGAIKFFMLRVARIYPLHFVVCVSSLLALPTAVTLINGQTTIADTLAVFTLTQAWIPRISAFFAINGVSWSISVELFFYLCFPFLSPLVKKSPAFTFGVVTAAVIFLIQIDVLGTGTGSALPYAINPIMRLPEFVLGASLFELRRNRREPGFNAATVFEATALLSVIALNLAAEPVRLMLHDTFPILARWFQDTGSMPAFGALIFILSFNAGMLSRSLSNKVMIFLGEISFALYLAHQPIMNYGLSNLWLVLALCFGVSVIAYKFIELPSLAWTKRHLLSHPTRTNEAVHG